MADDKEIIADPLPDEEIQEEELSDEEAFDDEFEKDDEEEILDSGEIEKVIIPEEDDKKEDPEKGDEIKVDDPKKEPETKDPDPDKPIVPVKEKEPEKKEEPKEVVLDKKEEPPPADPLYEAYDKALTDLKEMKDGFEAGTLDLDDGEYYKRAFTLQSAINKAELTFQNREEFAKNREVNAVADRQRVADTFFLQEGNEIYTKDSVLYGALQDQTWKIFDANPNLTFLEAMNQGHELVTKSFGITKETAPEPTAEEIAEAEKKTAEKVEKKKEIDDLHKHTTRTKKKVGEVDPTGEDEWDKAFDEKEKDDFCL